MIGSGKVLAVFLAAMICFCAVIAAGAVGSNELRITATSVGEYELEVKLENVCDYYLGNVDIKVEGVGDGGIEIERYGLSGGSSSGVDTIRTVAPGETVSVSATIDPESVAVSTPAASQSAAPKPNVPVQTGSSGNSTPAQTGSSGNSTPAQTGSSGNSTPAQTGSSGNRAPAQTGSSGNSIPAQTGSSGNSTPTQTGSSGNSTPAQTGSAGQDTPAQSGDFQQPVDVLYADDTVENNDDIALSVTENGTADGTNDVTDTEDTDLTDTETKEVPSQTIHSIAPGETVAVTATIAGGEKTSAEEITDASVSGNDSSDGGIPSYVLWIALGVAVVAAAVVAVIVIKKKKSITDVTKDISTVIIIAVLLVSLVSANAGTVCAASDTLKQAVDGNVAETITIEGKGDILVTVEYTVVPQAVTEPLKSPRPSDSDYDANSNKVDKRRIVEGAGPLTDHNIYIGKNDFMFYGQAIDDYTGRSIMTDTQLKKLSDMMTNRDTWANNNGIKLYLVIAPNKSTVYHDYVPDKVNAASKTNADYVVEYLAANSTVEVIDLRDPLIAARAEYGDTLFYKYDTHWNNNGGFVGYTEIMRRINEDIGGAYTLTKGDFDIAEYETYMKDMTYYLGHYSSYKDYGPVYTLRNGMTATIGTTESDGFWGQFKYCARWKDGYSDALKYVAYENKYNTDAPSVYVYRDSFAVSLIHFLKDSFHNSVFDWSYDFSRTEVLESGADVVIMEVVEKQLYNFMSTRTFTN